MREDTMSNEKKTQVTPLSLLALGNIQVLIFRAEEEGAPTQNYVSIRRQVPASEDATVIPVSQIPQLIEILKQVVPPAIQLRTLTATPASPSAPPTPEGE